ncbi:UNVERIFIED_CONTAM: Abscisic acid receptor PYL4 [Sesamum latifolium]|uniref:Abscisic acid receptor PYL4 n=1 Tax=Sesamum latifolium TaxID=2727402 RepID=A0AAW2XD98_9LAMI
MKMPSNHPNSSLLLQRINETPSTTAAAVAACKQAYRHPTAAQVPDHVARYHTHAVGPNQCWSAVTKHISAPSPLYVLGNGDVGTLREVRVISGLPAASSTERLEILDDERHVLSFSVVGGDHRLANYRSVTTLHAAGNGGTVVVESYVVDVPQGNTKEETCVFVDTIVKCNLQSLAQIAENLARRNPSSSP